jgi:hypothetical protein
MTENSVFPGKGRYAGGSCSEPFKIPPAPLGLVEGRFDMVSNGILVRWAQAAGIKIRIPTGKKVREQGRLVKETKEVILPSDLGRQALAEAIGAHLAKIHKAAGDAAVEKFLQDTGAPTK